MEKFNFDEITNFDEHIALSIPNYSFLIDNIKSLIKALYAPNDTVSDYGCSTGRLMTELSNDIPDCNFFGVDDSKLLVEVSSPNLKLVNDDLFLCGDLMESSIITSIFFLQFLPDYLRREALDIVKDYLEPNGYFIVCEKVYSNLPEISNIVTALHFEEKLKSFHSSEILNKYIKLSRSMRLKTENELIEEMSQIGTVTTFFKSFEFVGLIVKNNKGV